MRRRIDRLVAETLANGRIPDDATIEERNEVLRLVEAARELRAQSEPIAAAAEQSIGPARERFQRFMVQSDAAAAASRSGGLWRSRGVALAGSIAAAVVVLMGVLVVALAVTGGGVETASAMEVGDFVQLEGTVADADEASQTVELETVAGRITLEVRGATIGEGDTPIGLSDLRAGDALTLTGTVTGARRVEVATVARVGRDATPVPDRPIRAAQAFREGLEGAVVSFALAPDGDVVRVVIEVAGGDRVLVNVAPAAAREVLAEGIGGRVRVVGAEPGRPGILNLEQVSRPQRPQAGTRQAGVVLAVGEGRLTLDSRRGEIDVMLTGRTRFVLPRDLEPGDRAAVVGRRVMVAGQQQVDGTLRADVVVVGEVHIPGQPIDWPTPSLRPQ